MELNLLCKLDTAACQNVISAELFDKIISQSGGNPPTLSKGQIVMRLSDGSQCDNVIGFTEMSIAEQICLLW